MLQQRQQLDRSEIHDVLSNDRRWRVLQLLVEDSPRDLRSLADAVASAESGESPAPRQVRQSVYVTLHQNHLPKLDSLDVVEYDDVSKVVTLGETAEELDVYLEVVEGGELSWSEYHLGVVGLGLTSTLASAVGVPAFASLTPGAFSTGALLVLFASLAYQIREQGSPWSDRILQRARSE